MNDKNIFGNIKKSNIYILLEICLFVSNVLKLFFDHKPSYLLLILFIILIIYHVYARLEERKSKRQNEIPKDLNFVVEFANSIGYTDLSNINDFKDLNCSLDSITKTYTINKTNAIVVKEYEGRVKATTSDSIKIMTCGGSSRDLEDIKLNVEGFDYNTKQYIPLKFDVIIEKERTKLLKVIFKKILTKGDKFKIKYKEEDWDGSIR